ncbi:tigger transposable element-derived protein 1-like [Lytechinus pictus]|uniref:tigger transposable element-derived protein 1-like n=1 Tax=Lytechinus pictus TaxID=7653 RepID=UPI0030BA090F
METALNLVDGGASLHSASKRCSIPKTTLHDRVHKKYKCSKSGPRPVLSFTEEEQVVSHLNFMADRGYGLSRRDAITLASDLANNLKRLKHRPEHKRRLTVNWFKGFLGRWPTIRLVKPQGLCMSRAKSSKPQIVRDYFDELERILRKYNLLEMPSRIFNVDEVGFNCEHRPVKIVTRKSCHRPQSITSPRSALTTLIACGNAAGDSLPPFLVFKGKKATETLREGGLPGTLVDVSDSGWSNSELFLKFMKEHFLPYINGRRAAGEPVMLIYDGHKSHVSVPVLQMARANNIVLFVLPAHTSHFLQPLDVGVFSPMKAQYNTSCSRFLRQQPGRVITRYDLCHLIGDAYRCSMNKGNLSAGFRATGIFPLNRERIDIDVICGPSALVNPAPVESVENAEPATPTEAFLAERRPSHPPPSQDQKKRKYKYQAAGVAVTEEGIYLKILRVNNGDVDEGKDFTPAAATTSVETTADETPARPGPSGACSSITQPRRLVFDNAMDDDTDDYGAEDEDDKPCCVCGQMTPKSMDRRVLTIVNWVKCDNCEHWVHLRFCCRWFKAPRSYLCPCCSDE